MCRAVQSRPQRLVRHADGEGSWQDLLFRGPLLAAMGVVPCLLATVLVDPATRITTSMGGRNGKGSVGRDGMANEPTSRRWRWQMPVAAPAVEPWPLGFIHPVTTT